MATVSRIRKNSMYVYVYYSKCNKITHTCLKNNKNKSKKINKRLAVSPLNRYIQAIFISRVINHSQRVEKEYSQIL